MDWACLVAGSVHIPAWWLCYSCIDETDVRSVLVLAGIYQPGLGVTCCTLRNGLIAYLHLRVM